METLCGHATGWLSCFKLYEHGAPSVVFWEIPHCPNTVWSTNSYKGPKQDALYQNCLEQNSIYTLHKVLTKCKHPCVGPEQNEKQTKTQTNPNTSDNNHTVPPNKNRDHIVIPYTGELCECIANMCKNMAYKHILKVTDLKGHPCSTKGKRQHQTKEWNKKLVKMYQVGMQWWVHWRVSQNLWWKIQRTVQTRLHHISGRSQHYGQ